VLDRQEPAVGAKYHLKMKVGSLFRGGKCIGKKKGKAGMLLAILVLVSILQPQQPGLGIYLLMGIV
jgi:hypothetical protein